MTGKWETWWFCVSLPLVAVGLAAELEEMFGSLRCTDPHFEFEFVRRCEGERDGGGVGLSGGVA